MRLCIVSQFGKCQNRETFLTHLQLVATVYTNTFVVCNCRRACTRVVLSDATRLRNYTRAGKFSRSMRFQFPHSGIVCQNQIQITKRFSLLLLAQRSVSICVPNATHLTSILISMQTSGGCVNLRFSHLTCPEFKNYS